MIKFRSVFWLSVFLMFTSFGWAKIQVIEDTPENVKIIFSSKSVISVDSGGPIQWNCEGCISEMRTGKANRPYISILLGVGDEIPKVTLENIEWSPMVIGVLLPVSSATKVKGLSTKKIPKSLPSSTHDLNPIIGEVFLLKGIKTRTILIPLATWSASSYSFKMIKKVKINIYLGRNKKYWTTTTLPKLVIRHILNPRGTARLQPKKKHIVLNKTSQSFLAKSFITGNATNSALAYPYVKIQVGDENVESLSEDGFYRIHFDDVASLFTSISDIQVPVSKLKMFLGTPELLSETPGKIISGGNLREIPINIIDRGSLGTFDSGDEIILFVQGTSRWKSINTLVPKSVPIRYEFENDEYSFFNYYYLELFGSGDGQRLDTVNLIPPNPSISYNQSWHYLRAEKEVQLGYCDLVGSNDVQTGKIWTWFNEENRPFSTCRPYQQQVSNIPKVINYTLKGEDLPFEQGPLSGYQDTASFYIGFFTNFKKNERVFTLELAEGTPIDLPLNNVDGVYFYFPQAIDSIFKFKELVFSAHDLNNGIDGYSVIYKRSHIFPTNSYYIYPFQNGFTKFSLKESSIFGFVALKIQEGFPQHFLKITNNSFVDSLVSLKENIQYYLDVRGNYRTIKKSQLFLEGLKIGALQDFQNENHRDIEYLIIAPDDFLPLALELKKFWEEEHPYRSYRVGVVLLSDIYRHFSSGRVSPIAIRDFLRWAANSWGSSLSSDLEFVTLFGDGCYNYRKILRGTDSKERFDAICRIPPFTKQYMATDDFYGYLDSGETVLTRGSEKGGGALDVIIGRLPISSIQQAKNYLTKLRGYYNSKNYGYWRNIYLSSADDDRQLFSQDPITHINGAEQMARLFKSQDTTKQIRRNYLLDYTHNSSYQKPAATTKLASQINDGVLVFNYIGHGDYFVYSDESFLKYPEHLNLFQNYFKNFLLTSFSCTVGRFDLGGGFGLLKEDISLSEAFLMDVGEAGSIASFSAGRESLSGLNERLGDLFFSNLLSKSNQNKMNTIGDAMFIAKNTNFLSGYQRNSQKYVILGEPVLELPNLKLQISLENQDLDTLGSLECATLKGKINGGEGSGKVTVRIYSQDKAKQVSFVDYSDSIFSFATQNYFTDGVLLFENTIEYLNGSFEMSYFLPASLPLGDTNAVLQIYAWDTDLSIEGSFIKKGIHLLGESNSCDTTNFDGPSITVFGCDRTESSLIDIGNQVTIPNPYCLEVLVRDSLGGVVNTGENEFRFDLENNTGKSVLSGKGSNIISENRFSSKSFIIQIDTTITSGSYLLKLTSFDGFGNKTDRSIALTISDETIYQLIDAFNAPNPVKDQGTCFYFGVIGNETNNPSNLQQGEASINIYNQKGVLIRSLKNMKPQEFSQIFNESLCRSRNAWWDLKDYLGNKLPNGAYFYKLQFVQKNVFDQSIFRSDNRKGTIIISR